MSYPILALLASASIALAANNGSNNANNSNVNNNRSNTTSSSNSKTNSKKVSKPAAKAKETEKQPAPPAEPVSLIPDTVDAVTQMSLDAAKAAQAEVDKLAAIGGKAIASPSNAKLAEAAVQTGVAVATELTKEKSAKNSKEEPGKPGAEVPDKGSKKAKDKKAE